MILISFDIDGTLEVGDPPGVLTMDMVRRARERGFLIGSCSDRPMSGQQAIWDQHDIPVDFVVPKHMLSEVRAKFEADVYYHIGDRKTWTRSTHWRRASSFFGRTKPPRSLGSFQSEALTIRGPRSCPIRPM